ncbi:MAG: fused DSP-PTPase phosphatase/NAD kinase-like protein, partial [Beijerinckiaceae bacterium]
KAVGDVWRAPSRWDGITHLTGLERLRAWAHSFFIDHAFVRMAYLNFHKVTPAFWRSAQPTPRHLGRLARQGLKSVVSLRGGRRHGSWPLEVDACRRHGLTLAEFIVTSRGAPDKATILEADAFFAGLAKPVLIHCKSGADRAGFVAALYLIMQEGKPAAEAMQQLSIRYGHFHFAPTGILDRFFEMYRDEGEAKGIPFRDWVRDHYDPDHLKATFRPHRFSTFITEKLLHRE